MGSAVTFVPLSSTWWPWVAEKASPVLCEDTKGVVALREGAPVAAVVMDSWSHNSCLVHIVIEDPRVTRRLLRESCHYVFVTSGRGIVMGLTPANNERALKFNRFAGLTVVHRIKDGYAVGVDYVLQEMRKETCPWLPLDLREAA